METYRKLLDRKNGKENVGFYRGALVDGGVFGTVR